MSQQVTRVHEGRIVRLSAPGPFQLLPRLQLPLAQPGDASFEAVYGESNGAWAKAFRASRGIVQGVASASAPVASIAWPVSHLPGNGPPGVLLCCAKVCLSCPMLVSTLPVGL
jgi:hypothetical protein